MRVNGRAAGYPSSGKIVSWEKSHGIGGWLSHPPNKQDPDICGEPDSCRFSPLVAFAQPFAGACARDRPDRTPRSMAAWTVRIAILKARMTENTKDGCATTDLLVAVSLGESGAYSHLMTSVLASVGPVSILASE